MGYIKANWTAQATPLILDAIIDTVYFPMGLETEANHVIFSVGHNARENTILVPSMQAHGKWYIHEPWKASA